MRTISVSELRQRVADVIDDIQASDEPLVVLSRSKKAAYLVGSDRFERDQAELQSLRRAVFIREVREAEAEYAAGNAVQFDSMEDLLDDLRR